jgi:hypothetical protein
MPVVEVENDPDRAEDEYVERKYFEVQNRIWAGYGRARAQAGATVVRLVREQ